MPATKKNNFTDERVPSEPVDLHAFVKAQGPETETAFVERSAVLRSAKLIKSLRNHAGLTQGRLAELVGTTQSAISEMENAKGAYGPSMALVARIAHVCGGQLELSVFYPDQTSASGDLRSPLPRYSLIGLQQEARAGLTQEGHTQTELELSMEPESLLQLQAGSAIPRRLVSAYRSSGVLPHFQFNINQATEHEQLTQSEIIMDRLDQLRSEIEMLERLVYATGSEEDTSQGRD